MSSSGIGRDVTRRLGEEMSTAKLSLSPLKDMREIRQTSNVPMPGSTTTAHPTVRLQCGSEKNATGAKTRTRLPKEETIIGTWTLYMPAEKYRSSPMN